MPRFSLHLSTGSSALPRRTRLVAVTLDVAKGQVEVEALAIWFRQRLRAE
jgi:hypothetical protein